MKKALATILIPPVVCLFVSCGASTNAVVSESFPASENSVALEASSESVYAPTTGQQNALEEAVSYLSVMPFSRDGLRDQLEYEGYTRQEIAYAISNCGADWEEQAAKSAASYLAYSSFSRKGLIEQLEYEGFTHEQALYGVTQNGY